jgi:hypothetical protein
MSKKKVSFPFIEEKTPLIINLPPTPKVRREKYISDYDPIKAYQVGCRMAEEVQNPARIHFRSLAEEHANALLCVAQLYHQCSRVYRLDDKTLLQLCRALHRKK